MSLEVLNNLEVIPKLVSQITALTKKIDKLTNNSKYISKDEALKILGVSAKHLATLRSNRKVTFTLVGKEAMYLRSSLDALLEEKTIYAVA